MRWPIRLALIGGLFYGLIGTTHADSNRNIASCTLKLTIEGPIGPGSLDYLEQGLGEATKKGCHSILMMINTPGGSLSSTRLMVEKILSAPIPFLCLVGPPGGHAGSAGAILLMACHVSGAMPATNIGAATPIQPTGENLSSDVRAKLIQDTVSWMVSLAKLRGRNLELAEKIVSVAKAVDSEEAAKVHLVDTLAFDVARFMDFADGKKVMMSGSLEANVQTGALVTYEPSVRSKFLSLVASPELAYLIFMASLALLYFEITHSGVIFPGVAGAIGLVVSLVAFHYLDVRWGGAALIATGLGLMIAEAYLPTHGALGVGGVAAFAIGSLFLYDGATAVLNPWLVVATSLLMGGFMMSLAILSYRVRRLGPSASETQLINQIGEVASLDAPSCRKGMLMVMGEYWKFEADTDVIVGQKVKVLERDGMILTVK